MEEKKKSSGTMGLEDAFAPPFFRKIPVSFERGQGVRVWDEEGKEYIDLTAGWGVTSLGHASPVITRALIEQGGKMIQNPNSGASYSPPRAQLLKLLGDILPHGLTRIFFSNSGAEANDAAIKLARKASGKKNIISTYMSFHGRTISTASATGQSSHRDRYNPLMPNYLFVPYDDVAAVEKVIHEDVAAVIVEPVQGEGGIIVPHDDYLVELSRLCRKNDVYLILDEIQTGFFRTGTLFASSPWSLHVDFMTMAKGIAGGFPFGAFAMSEEVCGKLSPGDHGGTYCGNPLGCAVSHAVISHMISEHLGEHVARVGTGALERLVSWKKKYPALISDVRGRGLLIAVEFADAELVGRIAASCLDEGLVINVTHGNVIRLFPALNITQEEMDRALAMLEAVMERCAAE